MIILCCNPWAITVGHNDILMQVKILKNANSRADIFAIAWHVSSSGNLRLHGRRVWGASIHTHVEREREDLLDYSAARYKWKKTTLAQPSPRGSNLNNRSRRFHSAASSNLILAIASAGFKPLGHVRAPTRCQQCMGRTGNETYN
jgi:hypothetical protein